MTNTPTDMDTTSPLLVEVAWEVCNRVGGIYTVLRSKAPEVGRRFGDSYLTVGPYNQSQATTEFEACEAKLPIVADALALLSRQGMQGYSGTWLIPGEPASVLFDIDSARWSFEQASYHLWERYGIESHANQEVQDPIIFGFCVAQFLKALSTVAGKRPILGHFHEWLGGIGLLLAKLSDVPVKSIFTTHATILGRYLASSNQDYYEAISYIDPNAEARRFAIEPLHRIESACAHSSDIFSTVSELTAREAKFLLGREPEQILPNGLAITRYAAVHEFQNLHLEFKKRINEFVRGHFFPSYTFDLDNTLYVFTSGRYEYINKGMDVFIEALAELNTRLSGRENAPTIVAFLVTSAPTSGINGDVLKRQLLFDEMRHVCKQVSTELEQRLIETLPKGRLPSYEEMFSREIAAILKRSIYSFRASSLPAIVTHDLYQSHSDAILSHLRARKLFNHADDRVKVVFHPEFITSANPLFGLDYEQFVRGCHLGVFPSLYEPWGYTPLECLALGIPAVTSDLSGFGAHAQDAMASQTEHAFPELYISGRQRRSVADAAHDLCDHLEALSMLSRRERIDSRNRSEAFAQRYDWSLLIEHYAECYDKLVES
jgi:glycogen synthase